MMQASSMHATACRNILRASVALLLLPSALGFAPAISTMHLPASGKRSALCAPSSALLRVAPSPLAATMLDFAPTGEKDMKQRQKVMEKRRATAVLRTAFATLSAVCMLASATPASAFDGGSIAMRSEHVPAMVSTGLSEEAKVDPRVAVPQEYQKTTRKALMEMEVKAPKYRTNFGRTVGKRLGDLLFTVVFFGASLFLVPWHSFRREGNVLAAPHTMYLKRGGLGR
jgi:hypothetical protein